MSRPADPSDSPRRPQAGRPRGPVPQRVYWVRRVAVLGTALLLVFAVGRVLTGGSDASDGPATAEQAAAKTTPSASAKAKKKGKKSKPRASATVWGPTQGPTIPPPPVLAEPNGPCVAGDLTVVPSVAAPVGGADIDLTLTVTSEQSPACTWDVSSKTLVVKIRSGPDDIWSSRQCPAAIPRQNLVVRNNAPADLTVTWSARRSDEDCSKLTQWALPGWYHVASAAYGGNPSDVQFELVAPQAPVVTQTVTPTPTPTKQKKQRSGG